ncbi:MAG: PDZ domain-containing protein [Sulfurimonas sp.]|jgi:hypothetical protein|nr:PDZ domain-containing protein [Sulfurimonas sp.]
MFRLCFALLLSSVALFACEGGFDSCIAKVKDSHTIQKNKLSIPLKNNQKLLYSQTTPNKKILKHDPFLSLYLVEEKNNFPYPFVINNHLSLGYAGVNEKFAIEGKMTQHQIGLNQFAHFNEALFAPALLLNSCCSLEGIVTSQGIIEKEYIQRFIKSSENSYGDIGIRVQERDKKVYIIAIDPFLEKNPFRVGDLVVSFDGKKVQSASELMRDILFAKIRTAHRVTLQRENKLLNVNIKSYQRYGGGYLSDTFLEQKGIYFDTELCVSKLSKEAQRYGLKLHDKVLQVNGKRVQTQKELRDLVYGDKAKVEILLQRDGFQFFMKLQ